MRAILRHARIAPKKASLIAALVRRQSVDAALTALERLPKKGARLLRDLIASAAANAEHNAKQGRRTLVVKSLTVQKGSAVRRSIPMARGRARPIDKFTSHISVELGVLVPKGAQQKVQEGTKVTKEERTKEKKPAETLEHVDAPPLATFPEAPARAGEDPHSKGSTSKNEPRGPIFQPHQRGARGA